jgi:hypothetical protein
MTSNDPELRDDDCVTHDRLGPLEAMARYMSERDPHAGRDIARYVGLEAGDETVQHVEKVKVGHH